MTIGLSPADSPPGIACYRAAHFRLPVIFSRGKGCAYLRKTTIGSLRTCWDADNYKGLGDGATLRSSQLTSPAQVSRSFSLQATRQSRRSRLSRSIANSEGLEVVRRTCTPAPIPIGGQRNGPGGGTSGRYDHRAVHSGLLPLRVLEANRCLAGWHPDCDAKTGRPAAAR